MTKHHKCCVKLGHYIRRRFEFQPNVDRVFFEFSTFCSILSVLKGVRVVGVSREGSSVWAASIKTNMSSEHKIPCSTQVNASPLIKKSNRHSLSPQLLYPLAAESMNFDQQLRVSIHHGVYALYLIFCLPLNVNIRAIASLPYYHDDGHRYCCANVKTGAELLDYNVETGVWVFETFHWSRYAMDDSDDDDDDADNDAQGRTGGGAKPGSAKMMPPPPPLDPAGRPSCGPTPSKGRGGDGRHREGT